jgi:hypothetical protein
MKRKHCEKDDPSPVTGKKGKKEKGVQLLDLPVEVLAMILCKFAGPWAPILRMVCRQFASALKLIKPAVVYISEEGISGITGSGDELHDVYWCRGVEVPGHVGLTYEEFVRKTAPRLYGDVKRLYDYELIQQRISGNSEIPGKMEFDVYQRLVLTPPPPGADEKVSQRALRRINHAYMIYVESARGNIEFLSWLIFRRFCFDHSVLYGLFHSNMVGTISTIYSAASVFPYTCCALNSEPNNLVRPVFYSYRETLGVHFPGDRYAGWMREKESLIVDCLRIALNQGNLSAFKHLETMSQGYPDRYRVKGTLKKMWDVFLDCRWMFSRRWESFNFGTFGTFETFGREGEKGEKREKGEKGKGKGLFYTAGYQGHVDTILWVFNRLKDHGKRLTSTPAYLPSNEAEVASRTALICGWETGVLQGALDAGSYENFIRLLEGGVTVCPANFEALGDLDPLLRQVIFSYSIDGSSL